LASTWSYLTKMLKESMDAENPACHHNCEDHAQLVSESLLGPGHALECPTTKTFHNIRVFARSGALLFSILMIGSLGGSLLVTLEGYLQASRSGQLELLGNPLLCCGPHNCLLLAPDSVCGTTRFPVVCARGDIAAENSFGSGYCCDGATTSPCMNVCVNNDTRQRHLSGGGKCNGVAPTGFRASNTIMAVNLPWNSSLGAYEMDGVPQAMLPGDFFQYGDGDFTLVATLRLQPRGPSSWTTEGFTIFSKFDTEFSIGFSFRFVRLRPPRGAFLIRQGAERSQDIGVVTIDGTDIPVDIQVSHEYRLIRQNETVFLYIDGVRIIDNTFDGRVPNVNNRMRFSIGGTDNETESTTAYFSNMYSESFADFP